MNRREFLGVIASGSLALSAGCLDSIRGPDAEFKSGIHPDVEAEIHEDPLQPEKPPEVHLVNGTVIIVGVFGYGGGNCYEPAVTKSEYNAAEDRLDVVIDTIDHRNFIEKRLSPGCTLEGRVRPYYTEIKVDGPLQEVSVTEKFQGGETVSTTVEIS